MNGEDQISHYNSKEIPCLQLLVHSACQAISSPPLPQFPKERDIDILWILHELHSYKKYHKKMDQSSNVEARKLVLDAITTYLQQKWISWWVSLTQLLNQLTIFSKYDRNITPLESLQASYCQMMDNRP
jgi:hypothetical protein